MKKKRYAPPAAMNQAADLSPSSLMGSFQGAEFSRDRGYVWVPTLDSREEVDQWSRVELQSRAQVLFNSGGGFFNGAVKAIARMVAGTGLMPYPTPTKVRGREQKLREWSRKVRLLYSQRCGSANTFDLGRRFNTGQAQRLIIRNKIKAGDMFGVLAREEETNRLRVQFYEANQCSNGDGTDAAFTDGVKCDRHNAPVAFRFTGKDEQGKQIQVDIPAEHVLHCIEQERLHQVRGLTRAYPVLNQLYDRGEIDRAITKGIKVREHIAYAIEQEMAQQPGTPGGAGSTAGGNTRAIQLANGKQISVQEFLTGGEARELRPGQSFKVIESSRPSPQVREHKHDIIRSAARALGYSVEILWDIIELGGANMRFVQADTQAQIEIEQEDLVDQFLGPHYIAWIRDMIEHGEVEDVDGWELHSWLAPARLTVDFGRDGKLHIEQYKRGHITMKTLLGYRGEEWTIEIDQYLDERQYTTQGVYDRYVTVNGVARPMSWDEAFPELKQGEFPTAEKDQEDPEDKPEPAPVRTRI